MKINPLLYAVPALLLSACFQGENAPNTDDANDAAGTGSPYLARDVAGVHMLSEDHRFGYDEPCNMLDEGFIQNIVDADEVTTLDYRNGCEFRTPKGNVTVAFGGPRPYPSIYHAEYIFNKEYQGQVGQVSGQMGETGEKSPISGPNPEGTGAERPAIEPEGGAQADIDDDASTPNDSSNSISGVTSAAAQFTPPAVSTGRFVAVSGIGDKAVWEPAKSTLHVLMNNHILNVGINTKVAPAERQQKAVQLAGVVLNQFTEDYTDFN